MCSLCRRYRRGKFPCLASFARGSNGNITSCPNDTTQLAEWEELPAHTFDEEGEAKMQACAEVYLSEQAAGKILDRGIMPLLSYRNRNAVRLAHLQSLSDPPTALAGT